MDNVLLIQISDIHVKDEKSRGLSRLAELAPAVGSLRDACPHAVFLLTGDIAYSGKSDQYELIRTALDQVASRLRVEWRFQSVEFVTCPGNHDCDFDLQKGVVREALLSSISGDGDGQIDLVHELSDIQSSYYEFADAIEGERLPRHSVVRKVEKDVGGRKFNCLSVNTAWSSRIHEQPGSLRMPGSVLVDAGSSSELTIALLHHPLNWYDPQDGKSLSDWLDTNADIALWGHEHREDSFRVVRRRYGSSVQHFLARPIDDKDVECGFRTLELRTDGAFIETSFRWRGGRFEVERRDESSIKQNPARQLGKVRFSADFRAFLSDPGISFKHPRLERPLMLQDIFIEPSFRAYTSNAVELEKTDSSLNLSAMMEALSGHTSSVICGQEHSGKTTFAKFLVEDARHHGITPLYFDGARLRSSNRGEVTAWIRTSIEHQYAADCVQLVEQVPPGSRMIIVDNVHELRGNAAAVREVLERVAALGGRVIYLSAQNPAVTILAASHSSGEEIKLWSDAKWFELLPLGNRARGELIRRWVATGRDETADSTEIESEVRRVKALLDGALGRSLSIKLPFFLLAMLQQIDAGVAAKTVVRNGSHGHIFEAMLSSSIEGSVRSHDVGTTHDFLAAFAFVTWTADGATISESGFEELISEIRRDKLVQLSHPSLKEELVASKVLCQSASGVGFRYPHFYYYYLALWIVQRRGETASDDLLRGFVENIHTEMSANVVTFVAHLGEARLVLDLLLPAASSLFSGADECKLAERAPLAAKYSDGAKEVVLLTGDQQDVSDHHHDALDHVSRENAQETLEDAFKYTTAMRSVQVLGQVMRSQAGTLSAAEKKLITETSISLSRRLMSVMYDAAEISADLIVRHASELFDTEIKSNSVEARGLANRLIATVVGGIAKGLVCRAAEVFGTKDLVPLIDTLDEAAKASRELDNELIVLCARIVAEERYPPERVESLLRRLPESDLLSRSALAHAVARSFYYNPPTHAVRDSACARLGIQVRRIPARIHRDGDRGRS